MLEQHHGPSSSIIAPLANVGLKPNEAADSERRLQGQIEAILRQRPKMWHPMLCVIDLMRQGNRRMSLFGGVLRHIVINGPDLKPRDVDIVVECDSVEDLIPSIGKYVTTINRFGGLRLDIHGWKFDVWPLSHTWAFQERLVKDVSFSSLPQTTFFNIDAVAAELDLDSGNARIYEGGFFEGIANKTVEVNLESNPSPEQCVVRALATITQLNYSPGPCLLRFINRYSSETSEDTLMNIQHALYGRKIKDDFKLKKTWEAVQKHESKKTVAIEKVRAMSEGEREAFILTLQGLVDALRASSMTDERDAGKALAGGE